MISALAFVIAECVNVTEPTESHVELPYLNETLYGEEDEDIPYEEACLDLIDLLADAGGLDDQCKFYLLTQVN